MRENVDAGEPCAISWTLGHRQIAESTATIGDVRPCLSGERLKCVASEGLVRRVAQQTRDESQAV
jgi:hypothetical protein